MELEVDSLEKACIFLLFFAGGPSCGLCFLALGMVCGFSLVGWSGGWYKVDSMGVGRLVKLGW